MSGTQYAVRQDGMFVARVDASDIEGEDRAKREAMHYLAVYAQDGPCELWRRGSGRRWKPLGIRMGIHPNTDRDLAAALVPSPTPEPKP